jgi:acylpyruvate hydrolase
MYDGINSLAAGIATSFPDAAMVAGYVNGNYAWAQADWDLFPHANHVTISITASANAGDVLDVEPGNATPEQTAGWIEQRKASGYYRPTIYCNLGTIPAVRQGTGAYILGVDYDIWVADWTGSPHEVTAPGTPVATCSATQYESTTGYDASVVYDEGWPHRTAPATKPPAEPTGIEVTAVTATSVTLAWNSDADATSYRVRTTYQGTLVTEQTTLVASATVSGLDSDHTYTFHVAASNKAGISVETDGPTVKTPKLSRTDRGGSRPPCRRTDHRWIVRRRTEARQSPRIAAKPPGTKVTTMRFATLRTGAGTTAARLDGDTLIPLNAADVGELLATGDSASVAARAGAAPVAVADADFAQVVTNPSKIICVGLNYRTHIIETGRELPQYPTLFAKFTETLMGPNDDLVLPAVSEKIDWEAELGLVIGKTVHRADADEAAAAIAGYTVCNDVSMRDWQRRTLQWLAGKMFAHSTPAGLEIRCEVDDAVMQQARTSDLLFKPADVVAYASQAIPLHPGDLLLTGTTGGVGDARKPPVYLKPGQVVRTFIEGIGECVNQCVAEKPLG